MWGLAGLLLRRGSVLANDESGRTVAGCDAVDAQKATINTVNLDDGLFNFCHGVPIFSLLCV